MRQDDLKKAIAECERFIRAGELALSQQADEHNTFGVGGGPYSAAARRASMDASKALAVFRNPYMRRWKDGKYTVVRRQI